MSVDLNLATKRTALKAARSAFVTALFHAQQVPSAENDQALEQARATLDTAQTELNDALAGWLDQQSQDADFARLDGTSPIVCLPLRIETRFNGSTLQLRVFPDEIWLNSHEEALTPDEVDAARAYYETPPDGHREQWRQLVDRFGAERSAYILRIMTPDDATFPTDLLSRSAAWTRATEAVLPDRWIVMTRRGNARTYHSGAPIPEPLSTSPDPGAPSSQLAPLPNGYAIDRKLLWTVDYQTALSVGMAIDIPLSPEEAQQGFDRILVFGVKTSLDAFETGDLIENLLDAHHYTRGFALLPQGSLTNNTKDKPTAYPRADDAGSASFAIEREHPPSHRRGSVDNDLPPPTENYEFNPNARLWSRAIGTNAGVLRNVEHAMGWEHLHSFAASFTMWPLTFGSFLKFQMHPVFSEQDIADAHSYYSSWVTARGAAPAFRIGQVPYGVLAVSSLRQWQSDPDDQDQTSKRVEGAVIGPLRRLHGIWKTASSKVARVKPQSSTPDLDLISTLSLYPSTREVRSRIGFGGQLLHQLYNLLGWDIKLPYQALDQATSNLFGRLGHPEWRPRLGRMVYLPFSLLQTGPLVDLEQNLSETAPLTNNYLTSLAAADLDLLTGTVPKPDPQPVFFELLRIALVTGYALGADRMLKNLLAGYLPWLNGEIFGLTGLPSSSVVSMLDDPLPPTTDADEPLIRHARQSNWSSVPGPLLLLSRWPSAEVERVLTEQLDLASHRLDPWVSAMAFRRLFALRGRRVVIPDGPTTDYLRASHIAGYAWVEDVRPIPRASGTGPDGDPVELDPTNGGFIHAPSSTHAMTAAALRSGYLSFSGEDAQKYAIDLSSRRVRNATALLDEMRSGQHAGAVLGYRFERGLQDRGPAVPGLNSLRFVFRRLFPLVAGKDGVDISEPAEQVAARNVVDGMALYRAHRAGSLTFGSGGLPGVGSPQHSAVIAELQKLVALVDAVADVLVSEGVFQLARGNVTGAPASLANLVAGGVLPDPEVARSPRSGVGLTHRVVYVFPASAPSTPPAGWGAPTPRAAAEPVLNAWLGRLLGDPSTVRARVTYSDSSGSHTQTVTLAQLAIQPLDVLAMSRSVLQANQGSLLDARVIFAAIGDDASKRELRVDYGALPGRDPAVDRTFPEVFELAETLAATLGSAKPLAPAELVAPADADETGQSPAHAAEVHGRAQAGLSALDTRLAQLAAAAPPGLDPATATLAQLQALRVAIRAAGAIAPERAFTTPGATAVTLLDTARELIRELERRKAAVPGAAPTDPDELVAHAIGALKAVFGSDTFVMPGVDPAAQSLNAAFAARGALLGNDEGAPRRFLQQAMHGRPQLARYRKFALYARALGASPPRSDVVQLPLVAGEKWLALPFDAAPEESRASLVLLSEGNAPPVTTGAWRGIVLESWVEVIPAKTQPTSIAFHHNSPRAEAPQCVLVAVPPVLAAGTKWTPALLSSILEETLDLAKVRAVDRELVDVGQLVPGIVIPRNLDRAITTSSGPVGPSASVPSIFSKGFV